MPLRGVCASRPAARRHVTPRQESNTYFFDKCLGWSGVCVEPQPANYARFVGRRGCALAPFAVSDRQEVVPFNTFGGDWAGASGVGKVATAEESLVYLDTVRRAGNDTRRIEVTAFPMRALLDHFGARHVDYLSLDVEGHELKAVQSIDFEATAVDVFTIENSPTGIAAAAWLVAERGYQQVQGTAHDGLALVDLVLVAPGFRGFACGAALTRPDAYRMCSGDKFDAESAAYKATKYARCKAA